MHIFSKLQVADKSFASSKKYLHKMMQVEFILISEKNLMMVGRFFCELKWLCNLSNNHMTENFCCVNKNLRVNIFMTQNNSYTMHYPSYYTMTTHE